ncbi:MAG TPA: GMC family oxidoreductase N-terminal domain-containing protein [Gemmatimonadales bacterium]|nr:GMC family oxidoreductase N-terminal domain-containing protein [Gemmatimonadales bacterium]
MTERARRALGAVCETLVPGSRADLADRVAARVERLPRPADRADFARLLALLESPLVNLLLAGTPRPFSALALPARERYLRSWATSRLATRRRAFQALKRLVTVTHYVALDERGTNPAWSDIGYPGPLGPPPAAPKPIRPLSLTGDTTLDCDVVVVGSGAGGGVVAGELSARGRDVVVLEKGGYFAEADFTQREDEMLERLYDGSGLLTTRDLGLLVLQGSCVGGGTVVNYTTSFHPPETVRAEWAAEHGLPYFTSSEFQRSLDAVAARLGVNREETAPSPRDRVLVRGLERLGWHRGILPRNVRGCSQGEDCGYCGYGCRRGAKQSTLVTYLADAAARGARIVARAAARRVLVERGRAVGVEALVRDPDTGVRAALTVRARAVVVACGSIHSPALLLRSGLGHPALGRHLALHPATAVFALMDEEVRPWSGTLQSRYSDQFADLDRGYGFRFETAPLHPALAALAAPWESGAGHRRVMARLPRTALVGILLRDRDGGRVTADPDGQPKVAYRLSRRDAVHLRRGLAAAAEVLEAAGAREIWTPTARWLAYRPGESGGREGWLRQLDATGYGPNQLLLASFHQMSSCRMGGQRAHSVVNPEHQVWDVPGLYVADASVFPSASGVNPMLTIMGIAHRAAGLIAHEA